MNESYGTRSLREITRILFQHWLMFGLILLIGGLGTYLVCEYAVTPHYRSQITMILKRPVNRSPVSTDAAGERTLEVFVKAQQQIMMSDLVLARTFVLTEDAALRDEWYELQRRWYELRNRGDTEASEPNLAVKEFLDGERINTMVNELLTQRQADFNRFRKSVKLETPGGEQVGMTETFTMSVDQPADPMRAYYAADILADMYLVRFQEVQQRLSEPALHAVDDIIRAFRDSDFSRVNDAYQDFVTRNAGMIGVLEQLMKSGTEHGTQIVLTKVREDDAALFLEITREKAVYDVLTKAIPAGTIEPGRAKDLSPEEVDAALSVITTEFFKNNLLFLELSKNLATLEQKLAQAESQFTEESREVRYLREEVLRNKRRLLDAVVSYAQGLKASIHARENQKLMLAELVKKTSAEQNEIHAKLVEYARLKNEFEVGQKQLEMLHVDRLNAMSNNIYAREVLTINKLDAATVPDVDRPHVPLTGVYTVVALVVSLLLAIAFAFLADHFDHTLRSGIEAERYLGVPVLGSIKKRGRRLIVRA